MTLDIDALLYRLKKLRAPKARVLFDCPLIRAHSCSLPQCVICEPFCLGAGARPSALALDL